MSNQQDDNKPTHHYGRGGAGNVTTKPATTGEKVVTTPTLKSKMYTTGRGGTGNMAKNDSSAEARTAQDVDVSGVMLNENAHHTGRGGAANMHKPTEAEVLEAKENNDKIRRASFKGSQERPSGLRGVAEKAKEVVKDKTGKGAH